MRSERRLVLRLLDRVLPGAYGADIVADIEAAYEARRLDGRFRAEAWLWRQLLTPHTLRLAILLRSRGRRDRRPARRIPGLASVIGWTRVRQAARALGRRPVFTLTVALTLALGIGANTAIFSVVDGVLLEPLPYPDGDHLAYVWGETRDDRAVLLSGPQAAEVSALEIFERATMVFGTTSSSMEIDGVPQPIRTRVVSHAFFDVFGIAPRLGRTFRPADEFKLTNAQIRDPELVWPIGAMVISHALWVSQFGEDPGVLGRRIVVGGRLKEIVGVMPVGFQAHLPSALGETVPVDAWTMSAYDQPSFPRDTRFVRVVGRLRDRVDLASAQRDLDALSQHWRSTFPEERRDEFSMRAVWLQDEAGATARAPLIILFAAVGFVLLIACANVATLFVMRGAERASELRLRRALGASRTDIVGIGLMESVLAAGLGGVVGVAIAPVFTRILLRLAPSTLPRADGIGIDASVLAFTAAVTIVAALLAGFVPALRAARTTSAASDAAGRFTSTRREQWTAKGLVALEVALAVVLVTATGLMLRSLRNVLAVDPGFNVDNVVTFEATLTTPSHPTWESRFDYFRRMQDSLQRGADVRAAGIMVPVPFDGADRVDVRLGSDEAAVRIAADLRRTTPGALEALGIEATDGRLLEWQDLEHFDQLHAVVDRKFAELAWPDERAIGQVVYVLRREYGDGSRVWDEWKRVVVTGVVEPIRGRDLRTEDAPTVYVSYTQNMWGNPRFLVRGNGGFDATEIRTLAAGVDRRPVVHRIESLSSIAAGHIETLRFAATLIGGFGALGLLLAATGVYGLLAYTVGRRERELHIRAALGARRVQLSASVLASGLATTALGVLTGWAGAWAVTRYIASYLYGVTPTDPATFVTVALFLLLVAGAACWVPSDRAGRVDPASALR